MIVYGDPETWGMTVDQFLDFRRLEQEKLSSEKPLSKNKTYSEIDILSNIDAKNPSGITGEDIVTYPMPEFEGMEDPRYRQLELAEGGIVERESFKDGINYTRNPTGKNQYKTKTLEEIIQIKESYPDNFRPKDFIGEGTLNNVEEK